MGIENIGAIAASGGSSALTRTQVITSTTTWEHPDGYAEPRIVRAILMGGGGGGGGGAVRGSIYTDDYASGGGGGASGFLREFELPVTGPLSIVIGAGGTGGTGATYTESNFNNNSRTGSSGSSGNSGGSTSVAENTLGWSIEAPGGGAGGGGPHTQTNIGSSGVVTGGSFGYSSAMAANSIGSAGSGGSPGGGRYTLQYSNYRYSVNKGQRAGQLRVRPFGGAGTNMEGVNQVEAIDAHLARYLSGGGGSGQTTTRNDRSASRANGGSGVFGTGGQGGNAFITPQTPNAGSGYGAGGGGGGGYFFDGNGTHTGQDGADGASGMVILFY